MTLTVTHIVSGDLWAGAEVQVYQLIRALQERSDTTPTAVVFNNGILSQKLSQAGIRVTVTSERELSPIQMIMMIRRHLLDTGTCVVHTHGFKENILGVAAQRLAGIHKSVRTVHGNPEHLPSWSNPPKMLLDKLDKLIGKLFQQRIVAVSKQLKADLSKLYPGKTELIHNFIDVDELLSEQASTRSAGKGQRPFKLGLVGRLVPVKRGDLFIDIIKELRNTFQLDVEGIVIGDGPLKSTLEEQIRDLDLGNQVTLSGFLNPALPAIAGLDALVMPSDHEGLPMTLIETLALGVPIVAHHTGGIPEALNYGKCGMLVSQHTAQGYAAALNQLLTTPDLAAELSSAGKAYVRTLFDKKHNVLQYANLYHSLSKRPLSPKNTSN